MHQKRTQEAGTQQAGTDKTAPHTQHKQKGPVIRPRLRLKLERFRAIRAKLTSERWHALAASCLVTLCIGSLYSWSVFAGPMSQHISELSGGAAPNLAIVFIVANSIGPITMISGGAIEDRVGPKWVLLIGGLLFGGGMIAAGFTSSVAGLIVTYGLGGGLGMGMVYGTVVANAVKMFPDKRGLAGGLTTAFYGGGSIIIPPIAHALIEHQGVQFAFWTIGAVAAGLVCIATIFIPRFPSNFRPVGWTPDEDEMQPTGNFSWKQMLRDPMFFVMFGVLTCGAFAGLMIISQTSTIAQEMIGFTTQKAALTVSVLALFNTIGRVVSGMLSDKFGPVRTLFAMLGISSAACVVLFTCQEGSAIRFFAGLALVGLGFGSIMGVFPGFTSAQFGPKHNTVNYGIMFIGFSLAGIAGPMVMNAMAGSLGQYQPAFLVAALFCLVGAGLTVLYHFLRAHRERRANSLGSGGINGSPELVGTSA